MGIARLVPAQADDPHALDGLRMEVRAFIAGQRSAGAIGTGVDSWMTFLPRIAAGTCFFGIGMSEPDSGSDLASVRTRAPRS